MADDLVLETKKKTKKSKKTLDLDAATEGVADLDLTEKPKKKKKKEKKADDEDENNTNAELDLDLPKKEKKEKKKKKKDGEEGAGDSAQPTLVLEKKKKKKDGKDKKDGKAKSSKKTTYVDRFENLGDVENQADYGYENLLDRVFDLMSDRGLGKGVKEGQDKRFTTKPPKMSRMGTKRTVYENFGETCNDFNRDPKHVMNYILTEVGATGNITEKHTLIIKGKYTSAMMEKILRPYIKEYVLCKTCISSNTKLTKMDRLTFIECNDCSSKSTVQTAKRGFEAITGKRKRIKDQQGGAATLNAVSNK